MDSDHLNESEKHQGNLFENLVPLENGEERIDCLLEACNLLPINGENNLKIERIVSDGHASPEGFWYDQPQSEWVVVLSGSAVLTVEGKPSQTMNPGDWINLPAHTRHRVESTARGTVWLAVHYPEQSHQV